METIIAVVILYLVLDIVLTAGFIGKEIKITYGGWILSVISRSTMIYFLLKI